jgi:predicted hotdog family 3-hydroxylacyl-ACP dehydratase
MQDIVIDDLIPHRGRMKLIAAVVEVDNDHAVTLSTVVDSWPLLDGESMSPIVLIEVAAQTAGVLACWKKGANRSAYKAGVLTGIKSAEFFVDAVPLGAELITTVNNRYSLDDYEAMEGTVMMGEQCLGIMQLQIFWLRATPDV